MTVGRRPRTALVVDDSARARRRIGTLLRLGGWRVHEAVGMANALRSAAAVDPDLVVTDMTMRRGNGSALMRALRRSGCRARFLAVSCEITDDVRARAAAADAAACLAKPVDPRLLVDVLVALSTAPAPQDAETATRALHVPAERLDLYEQLYAAARSTTATTVAGGTDCAHAIRALPGQATRR